MTTTLTTCPYCGVGCGISASTTDNSLDRQDLHIRGDDAHPANLGRLCVKRVVPLGRHCY
ncbi:hypothetical protein [Alishewanella longhuensis]